MGTLMYCIELHCFRILESCKGIPVRKRNFYSQNKHKTNRTRL